jgi:hypothetical protein
MSVEQRGHRDIKKECDNVLPGQDYFMVTENILSLEEQITSLSRIVENKIFSGVESHTSMTEIS